MARVELHPKILDIVADRAMNQWLDQNGPKLVRYAKQEAPRDTGHLRSLIRLVRRPGRRAELRSDASYSAAVHDGHREIVPVNAKVLRFTVKGGAVVFTRRVRAMPGNPFLTRAATKFGLKLR